MSLACPIRMQEVGCLQLVPKHNFDLVAPLSAFITRFLVSILGRCGYRCIIIAVLGTADLFGFVIFSGRISDEGGCRAGHNCGVFSEK